MENKFDLTKSEYEVMKILWDNDIPMLKQDILEKSDRYKWNDNYLKKMLTVLYKKGAIESVGVVRVGKVDSRLYVPTMSEDEYNISKYPVQSMKAIASLVGSMYRSSADEKKEELVNELEELLKELKED